ncbi:MAG: hypothetical protein AB3N14_14425 [Flavobacteriaceae bacterium]
MESRKWKIWNYSHFLALGLCFLLANGTCFAQNKYEREYRIKKSQFPKNALLFLDKKIQDARRVRFYKETDSAKASYEAKFKKDKLNYSVEFDEQGALEDIEILIKPIDIPEESMEAISNYLTKEFTKFRIRKIQQQYPVSSKEAPEVTLKNAFQNLLLPSLNYELIVAGKKAKTYADYEVLFNAEGAFIRIRKSLPANYDHVLY